MERGPWRHIHRRRFRFRHERPGDLQRSLSASAQQVGDLCCARGHCPDHLGCRGLVGSDLCPVRAAVGVGLRFLVRHRHGARQASFGEARRSQACAWQGSCPEPAGQLDLVLAWLRQTQRNCPRHGLALAAGADPSGDPAFGYAERGGRDRAAMDVARTESGSRRRTICSRVLSEGRVGNSQVGANFGFVSLGGLLRTVGNRGKPTFPRSRNRKVWLIAAPPIPPPGQQACRCRATA